MGIETVARAAPHIQRVLENRYAHENLSDGIESLRAAYRRASKRRVEPTRDEKLRNQVREAANSITEAARAIHTGRSKPKPRWGRRILAVVAVGATGTVVVFAASERARNAVFGGGSELARSEGVPAGPATAEKVPA
jgi:hypothetical protein